MLAVQLLELELELWWHMSAAPRLPALASLMERQLSSGPWASCSACMRSWHARSMKPQPLKPLQLQMPRPMRLRLEMQQLPAHVPLRVRVQQRNLALQSRNPVTPTHGLVLPPSRTCGPWLAPIGPGCLLLWRRSCASLAASLRPMLQPCESVLLCNS